MNVEIVRFCNNNSPKIVIGNDGATTTVEDTTIQYGQNYVGLYQGSSLEVSCPYRKCPLQEVIMLVVGGKVD